MWITLILLALAAVVLVVYMRFPGPPETLGVREGRLSPCPTSPNCVSSLEEGDKFVPPLTFEGSPEAAMDRLAELLAGMEGGTMVSREARYLHAKFRTPLLGFVDDVECLLDTERRTIHVRSASRRGYGDLGTNRKRVEAIRSAFRALNPDREE